MGTALGSSAFVLLAMGTNAIEEGGCAAFMVENTKTPVARPILRTNLFQD